MMRIRSSYGAAGVLALVLTAPLTAQDCTLRYRFQLNATNATLLPFQEITLNAGQTRTIEGNYLRAALNDGGHDVRIVLGAGPIETEHDLIDVNGQTVILPPVAIAGQQLVRAECGSHATYTDAAAFIQNLGTSATQIVQQATAAAQEGAQQVRADALALLDTLDASVAWNDIRDLPTTLSAEWDDVRRTYDATPGRFDLDADFPEFGAALRASGKSAVTVGSTLPDIDDRLATLSRDLAAFDRKYRVTTPVRSVADDLPSSFPDLAAVLALPCPVDLSAVQGVGGDLDGLVETLRSADARFDAASAVASAMTVPAAFADALAESATRGWCDDMDEILATSLEEDAEAFDSWADRLATLAGQLRGGPLRARDWEAIQEGRREIRVAREAAREAEARRKRHDREYRRARERADADGRITPQENRNLSRSYETQLELRIEERIRRRDLLAAKERYSETLQRIQLERATPSEVRSFRDAVRSFPKPTLDDGALDAAISCAESLHGVWTDAGRALDDAIAEAEALAASAVPDDVKTALTATLAAAEALAAGLAPMDGSIANLSDDWNAVRRDMASLSPEVRFPDVSKTPSPLGPVPVPYPAVGPLSPDAAEEFREALLAALSAALESAGAFQTSVTTFRNDWSGTTKAAQTFAREAGVLAAAIRSHGGDVAGDVAQTGNDVAESQGAYAAADAALQGMEGCSAELVEGLTTTIGGAESAIETVLSDLLSRVPPEVLEAVDEVRVALEAAVAGATDLRGVEADAATLLDDLRTATTGLDPSHPAAFVEWLVEPARWQTLSTISERAAARADIVEERKEDLRRQRTDLLASLAVLVERAAAAGRDVGADASAIVFTSVERETAATVAQELDAISEVWAAALAALPGRMRDGIVPAAVSFVFLEADVRVEELKGGLEDAVSRAGTEFSAASDAVRQVASSNAIQQATAQTLPGLQGRASAVLSGLQALLNPTAGILGSADQAFADAADLAADVEGAGEAAGQAFMTVTAASRQSASDALEAFEDEREEASTIGQEIMETKNAAVERIEQILERSARIRGDALGRL